MTVLKKSEERGSDNDPEIELFEDAYKKHSNKLYTFIYLRIGHRETAEELVQEVFVRFIRIVGKTNVDPSDLNIKAYLYKIARNLVIDHYRSAKHSDTDELSEDAAFVEQTESRDDIQKLLQALDKLKPEWCELIILKEVQGFNLKEIAHATGKSHGSVRVMAHRAMKELRNILSQ
jgi:RNA polymerase sigma-70 factor, ECF subfamily